MAASDSPLTALYEAIGKTMHEFLEAYEHASKANDPSRINTPLTPDCKRHFMPPSFLQAMGVPSDFSVGNEVYEARWATTLPVYSTKRTEINNVAIDVWKKTAAATTVLDSEFIDGESTKLYFAWFMEFTEDGSQIKEVWEYVDSVVQPGIAAKCEKLFEEQKAKD
ncbi:hypothetical protein CKAH01_04142 [Colletotrichum kahawae]|uniref:SnoaL-like domain-containing protein n=1 Tax=Colletotrichum kahawae TaxID=34407 RepID=A0AAD9YN93_COLKA|nr:hypothetical protein CKAH01_04142 [Colletotrichum kahawae]